MNCTESNESCEPMDIDLSGHSVCAMDISPDKSNSEVNYEQIKSNNDFLNKNIKTKKKYPYVEKKDSIESVKTFHIIKPSPKKKNSTIYVKVVTIIVIFLAILTYYLIDFKCTEIDVFSLKQTLSQKLYGQDKVIHSLVNVLNSEDKSKLIFFYGGTGVGKTYTSSLILDAYGLYSNVYHYTMPTFTSTFSRNLMPGFTICKSSIVIVDDLTKNDLHICSEIEELFAKSENLGKNITVLLIYNCADESRKFTKECDKSFEKMIFENFREVNALKSFIWFEPLTETHLRQCVENEIGYKINDSVFNRILKNFDVTFDGCKGVYNKIKSLKLK